MVLHGMVVRGQVGKGMARLLRKGTVGIGQERSGLAR
jgi:hypothetical protein